MTKFKVIKEISKEDSWEIEASVGEILTVQSWERVPTLMKGDKAVCDLDSEIAVNHCKRIEKNGGIISSKSV